MAVRDQFRQAMVDGDVNLIVSMWATFFPGEPQPANKQVAEVQMHMARTAARSVPFKFRAYSHHWLTERSLPSLLPDPLRPKAEQFCPKIIPAVGFAWGSESKILKPAKPYVQAAVAARIEELAADGKLGDTELVKREIILAKNKELYGLFGQYDKLTKKGRKP